MPDRILDPAASRRTHALVTAALGVMTLGVVFLSGIVIWAILADRPDEQDVQRDIKALAVEMQSSQQANACTAYQNHRAIEEALRDIARLNRIQAGPPRVLPSLETVEACRAVGVEIDSSGVPVLPGDH